MVLIEIALITLTVCLLVYVHYQRAFQRWKNDRVPFRPPSFPFGNMENPFTNMKSRSERLQAHWQHFKDEGLPYGGIYLFSQPSLVVVDPEFYKRIMITDFDYFVNRGLYHNVNHDPLSGMIIMLKGKKWKKIRAKITPTFTSGKMKMMYNTVYNCSKEWTKAIDSLIAAREPVDIRNMAGCLTADVICTTAFGLQCDVYKDPNEPFMHYGRKLVSFEGMRALKYLICLIMPKLCKRLGVKVVPEDVAQFFGGAIKSTVEYRQKSNVQRKDFLQLMIDMYEKNELSFDEISAQILVFYLGGFETSSTTTMLTLYELGLSREIQEKARDNVSEVVEKYNGEITYESLQEMTYLCQVVDETMRKYPLIPVVTRKCVKDYRIPETDSIIRKGTTVQLSLIALHKNPEYFPDPERFDPDRFSEENKKKIKPFTYLPFGDGPRNCIGRRFGLMQTRMAVASFLLNYRFGVNEKTPYPLKFNDKTITIDTTHQILLDVEKINGEPASFERSVEESTLVESDKVSNGFTSCRRLSRRISIPNAALCNGFNQISNSYAR